MKQRRMKHDYTNEVELKSLAIREKNKALKLKEVNNELNDEIDELIKEFLHTKSSELKARILSLSEQTAISQKSHEIFGEKIILMIKKILTKSNFAGYTWRDEFFSDSCYRVFKYIHNFDHTLSSSVTGQPVSCFSYITQIIHNSILAIINEKNKKAKELEEYAHAHNVEHGIFDEKRNRSTYQEPEIDKISYNLEKFDLKEVVSIIDKHRMENVLLEIKYKDSIIKYDEYCNLREHMKDIKCSLNLSKLNDTKEN